METDLTIGLVDGIMAPLLVIIAGITPMALLMSMEMVFIQSIMMKMEMGKGILESTI